MGKAESNVMNSAMKMMIFSSSVSVGVLTWHASLRRCWTM